MDDCSNPNSAVAAGVGNHLHDGRIHSHYPGHCHYRYNSRLYSGAARVAGGPVRPKNTGIGPGLAKADEIKVEAKITDVH